MNLLSVNELFSGIGSQRKALERLGIPHKVVGISEIDEYAIKSYESIFGKTRNYGDISVVEKLDYADFWTYSFPCQDISISGKQAGINKNTRSGLLYQVERLLNVSKAYNELPKYLMLENVKNLVGKKFKNQFDEWLNYLDELGYNNYWQVLNAKDYGIPQNRERVFAISIRKDVDNKTFQFPESFKSDIRLKDLLESTVDERFYLSKDKVDKFASAFNLNDKLSGDNSVNIIGTVNSSQDGVVVSPNGISPTHTAGHGNCPKIIEIPCVVASRGRYIKDNVIEQQFEINNTGNTNTITTVQKDNYIIEEPQVLKPERTDYGKRIRKDYEAGRIQESRHNMTTLQPRKDGMANTLTTVLKDNLLIEPNIVIGSTQKNAYIGDGQYSSTLTSAMGEGGGHVPMIGFNDLRIRKLIPKECWRLMGFDDEDFEKAQKVNSNTQLYKQAGNSIVVNVLYYIFKNAFSSYIIASEKTA